MKSFQFNLPIIFLLLTTYSCSLVQSIQFRLKITNELTNTLETHCTLKGVDIGVFPIQPGGMNGYSVNYDNPRQSTIATCALDSGKLHGKFVMFDNIRDSQRCGNNRCEWYVKNDGLYLDIQGKQVFQFRWN
ncbi:hypothetical protein FXO38_31205 [Capsicum annuum]|uniref:Uncharacterized protein n=1 Tax=Capsicum annuum TaxID=4072 RepID=A0A2G2ZUG7_CAPAN|nr:hypothetical protein FXO38_31205 [Capsicum annuum]KAF3646376.1 hypothetical protein FXO37_20479 [Capsicum annuum]PHT85619.1 hypothetical protein T459_07725 [Capsicum annuum]